MQAIAIVGVASQSQSHELTMANMATPSSGWAYISFLVDPLQTIERKTFHRFKRYTDSF